MDVTTVQIILRMPLDLFDSGLRREVGMGHGGGVRWKNSRDSQSRSPRDIASAIRPARLATRVGRMLDVGFVKKWSGPPARCRGYRPLRITVGDESRVVVREAYFEFWMHFGMAVIGQDGCGHGSTARRATPRPARQYAS